MIGLPVPLLPLHLLWINIVTDGLPALALVTEPTEDDALQRPPRNPKEPILGRSQWNYILLTGLIQATVTLSIFAWALRFRGLGEARNLALSTLVFGELFRAFAARSMTRTFWELGALKNIRLLGVVLVSALIQVGIQHIQAAQSLFQIGTLSWADCALSVCIGLCPVTILEIQKLIRRKWA